MTSSRSSTDTATRIGIILLTFGTAIIHLTLAFPDPMFILNGLGYLGLLAALYLPIAQLADYRSATRWVLVGYTALTIFMWLVLGERTPIGYTAKTIEVALIVLLLIEGRRLRR